MIAEVWFSSCVRMSLFWACPTRDWPFSWSITCKKKYISYLTHCTIRLKEVLVNTNMWFFILGDNQRDSGTCPVRSHKQWVALAWFDLSEWWATNRKPLKHKLHSPNNLTFLPHRVFQPLFMLFLFNVTSIGFIFFSENVVKSVRLSLLCK